MNPIQRIIDRHDRLKVLQTCIEHNKDDNFRKVVLGKSPYNVAISVNETKRNNVVDKVLYRIEIGTADQGFFAEYRRTLNYLYYADVWGFIPYIEYNDNYVYSEKKAINGSSNPFEYYFVQPCVNSGDINDYHYVTNNRECDVELVEWLKPTNGYGFSDEYIDAMARISKKYIKLNSVVEGYLNEEICKTLRDKKTLGIHVRLSDFKQNYYGHPVCVSADRHLEIAKQMLDECRFEQVFLATDDVDTIMLFKNELGDKVVYYDDVMRTTGDISVAFSKSNRENHHYLLGLEVLRDMYTLSLCNGLIAGKSQVSICAMIENRNHNLYEYVNIIDLGYNTNSSHLFSESFMKNCEVSCATDISYYSGI